ncbi:MAG: flippase [Planctomycetota bacterium]
MQFVLRSAGGTLLLRLFYLASGFITTLLLTRWLGAEGLGTYNFVISWVVLSVIFVKFGFEEYLARETARELGGGNSQYVNRLWKFAIVFILSTSTAVVAIMALTASQIKFEDPSIQTTFYVGVAMVPLLAGVALFRAYLRSHKQILRSQLPEYLIRPTIILLVVSGCLVSSTPGSAYLAMAINVSATIVAIGYCFVVRRKSNNQSTRLDPTLESRKDQHDDARRWIAEAMPFVLIAGIHIVNQRADRLMLGSMIDMKSVGIYSVAAQMSLVVNFTLLGINQSVGPLVAERNSGNRVQELQKTILTSTLYASIGSILIVFGLASFGQLLLKFFGEEFSASYVPMLILAAGQLLNVFSGPAGEILSMSRHERLVGVGIFAAAILNLVLNSLLIPRYGVVGAAIATSTSMACWNLILVTLAKSYTGLQSSYLASIIPISNDDSKP